MTRCTWHIYGTPHGLWAHTTLLDEPGYALMGTVRIQEAPLYVGSTDERRRHYAGQAVEAYKAKVRP